MSNKDQTDYVSNKDLAREFYQSHQLAFTRAAAADKAEARRFDYSGELFDDWAAAGGYMPGLVRNAGDATEKNGLAMLRSQLRYRINRAARKGDGVPRAFSVEARYGRWRVVLIERFLEEQPHEIVESLWKNYERAQGRVETLKKQSFEAEHLSDGERTLIQARLEGAESAIFFGIQQVELAVHQIHPDAKMPDLRKLRRQMSDLMRNAFYGKPARQIKAKARKITKQTAS